MTHSTDILSEPLVVIPLFIAGWIGVGFVVAALSGWRSLAARYAVDSSIFRGRRWRMRSANMRWGFHYDNVLTIGADSNGLYLSTFVLFRAGHPSLYIPWEGIEIQEEQGWIFSYIVFRFKALPDVYLRTALKLGAEVAHEGHQSVMGEHARVS